MHIISPTAAANTPVRLESETALRMAEAASAFVASLRPEQRQRCTFGVDDGERLNWHYVPRERSGIPLRDLDAGQRHLFHALLAAGLSRRGYIKAVSIMGLEQVLGVLEGSSGSHRRDPDLYYISIFGAPSDRAPWGWRVEGHHLSVNILVIAGERVAPTPNFFGANPAKVPQGSLEGLRILAAEEDLARRLLSSLPHDRQQKAIIAAEAPADILTKAAAHVDLDQPDGLPAADLEDGHQQLLMDLIVEYVSRVPRDVADARLDRIHKDGLKAIHVAWAGGLKPGDPHYYRLHGPSFLVEYDDTQNNANHIHSVWRDLEDDWGEDLLRSHYHRSHRS
jgi:hypothetical protein